ncbi:DUF1513 domain-containing protein [Azospirillum doebereinerae]|uniref:DUF1513 domain-containing protein n=1 Tax=Azospirillum doebereinerae TaxID=92933 RepID=A0A3S0WKB7_9PROT|nr:DUF1513 domain-containing protein [Azospirillum doebereinerae]MCG5240318.1 DUF1513 domain-containing protein [Azospirillum doebereinerae]RUQ67788.1 DUF1513 domain-containing protein [Azospirillum doebereinerae]
MTLNRRNIMGLLGGGALGSGLLDAFSGLARALGAGGKPVYLNAYATAGATPDFGVAGLGEAGAVLFTTPTPGRAHAIEPHPTRAEAVAFARRPGRWFMPLSLTDGAPGAVVKAPDDRRFTGHGVFSADGALLYVAEDDVPNEVGAIGVYDANDGYRRLGALPTHGLGPHELLLMADGAVLAVANGGVITHPDTGRAKLNLDEMDSSLTYVEAATGRLIDKARLPAEHSNLGMRHIALLDDGAIAFGVQDERPNGELQPLTGTHKPGGPAPRLFDAPEDLLITLDGYIGSVASDGKVLAASSPKGGLIALWDGASGDWLGSTKLPDGCGLAAGREGFVATSGLGVIETLSARDAAAAAERRTPAYRWDNHLTRV